MIDSHRDSQVRTLARGFRFLEGPRWHDGKLYVSDIEGRVVLTLQADGTQQTLCHVPGKPSGLGFAPDGALLIVSMTDRRLLRLEANGRTVEIANLSAVTPFACNDMVVDAQGRAYVGNLGWDTEADDQVRATNLLFVNTDGKVSVAAENLVFPNGAAITPDGRTLIVAETFASRISAFDIAADGSLTRRRLWAQLSQKVGTTVSEIVASRTPSPDGLALDEEGAIWIADASGNGALRIAEGGTILDRVSTGDSSVYAVALGGEDGRTLFMCAGPRLLTFDPRLETRAELLACEVEVGTAPPPNAMK